MNSLPTIRRFWGRPPFMAPGLMLTMALGSALLWTAPNGQAQPSAHAGPSTKAEPNSIATRWLATVPLMWLAGDAPDADPIEQAAATPEAVIMAQIAAISSADWEAAFSFATLSIQSQFGTPQRFAAMVQGGFSFMIEPKTTELSTLGLTDTSALVEAIFISDSYGVRRVIYSLERNSDQEWRIAGVLPSESPDLAA